jgi:hypothetical protein
LCWLSVGERIASTNRRPDVVGHFEAGTLRVTWPAAPEYSAPLVCVCTREDAAAMLATLRAMLASI